MASQMDLDTQADFSLAGNVGSEIRSQPVITGEFSDGIYGPSGQMKHYQGIHSPIEAHMEREGIPARKKSTRLVKTRE